MTMQWLADFWKLNARAGTIMAASGPVMVARLTQFAINPNSTVSRRESASMVTEKVQAAQQSGVILAQAWVKLAATSPSLFTDPRAGANALRSTLQSAHEALEPYEKRVLANKERLR